MYMHKISWKAVGQERGVVHQSCSTKSLSIYQPQWRIGVEIPHNPNHRRCCPSSLIFPDWTQIHRQD